ncbi:MAG: hypothetical protein K0S26_869 [Bacteroidota bacterium]|nr:hypothetical protein [Bacteroidota bacterium]
MHKIYLVFLLVLSFNVAFSQGENCSAAVLLTNGACVAGTPGTSQNIIGCVGNADDDSWYRFVASSSSHSITVTGSASYDAVLQVFSGTSCGALISMGCVDNTLGGQAESMVASGLTPTNTYYVRVYHYFAGSGAGTFTMCLNNAPAPPANNNCASAINLAVNAACVQTSGTTYGATTQTLFPTCAGTPNDDVWYTFTATNYTQTIQVAGSASMDPVIELFDGTCGAFTSLSCTDNTFSGGTETTIASGLTPGNQYFFRVYDYYSSAGSTFSVCVSGNSIISGTQPNDEPCNAILLPTVTADCNYSTFSNENATLSAAAPSPTNCLGGTGGFDATTKDVWFAITVPANGNLCITPQPNLTGTVVTDGVMALYSGSCGSLTQIACSDDADGTAGIYNYPGSANDFLPYINQTGLTPGSKVYLRYWGWEGESGEFGICVSSPTNDNCANALYICDLNGYSSSTNAAYSADWPSNMKGDAETTWTLTPAPPHYNFVPGNTPSGGIFGLGGAWGAGQPYVVNAPCIPFAYDVQINNNSWLKFTAASTVASFSVTVSDCWLGGCQAGIQMQIFSAVSACTTFTPVSDYRQSASSFSISANSLVVGQDYYVMVDGWGGDICNYNIQALTGVSFPGITASPPSICPGQSSILSAPLGATGYTWEPTGETTRTISVAPGTTMTYTCYVGGVCGFKQTLTKTVTMLSTPTVAINSGTAIVNCGTKTTTLTGSGASTYTWSTGSTSTSFTVAPSGNQSYSVVGTATNGCTSSAITNVTVNAVPSLTFASSSNTICNGASATLSVTGANTYTWAPAGSLSSATGSTVTASPTTGTNYTITATGVNSCTNSANYSVTVNPKPTVSSSASSTTLCSGASVTFTGTGSASTYTWTGGITDGVAFIPPTGTSTYTVTGTNATTSCTNQATRTITVSATPTLTPAGTNTICNGSSTSLSTGGASSYSWSPSSALSSPTGATVTASPTVGTNYTIIATAANSCTSSATYSVSVNSKPSVTSTASSNTLCNGSSATLTGTGTATTYTWTGGITNGVAFNPALGASSYTVTGTDATTGCTNTAVRTITVYSIPTSTVSTSGFISCATNTINLIAGLSGQSYTWTAPGGSSMSGGTANSQNAIGQGPGTYTLTVLSPSGCAYSTTLAANVNMTTPSASATGGTLTCAVTSITLTGSPASGVTYNWSGPGISGSATSANATATTVGTYSLITTNTLTGCSNSVAAVATVTNNLTTPTVSAGSNQVITCAVPSVTLTGSATAGSTLNWSNGATTNTTTVGGANTYTLTATNPATGCFSVSTVQVMPSAGTPTGSIGAASNSITCTNLTSVVSITTGISPVTYSWTGPGTIASPTSSATTVSSGGNYTVTITNTASCSQAYAVNVPSDTNPVPSSASLTVSGSSITCSTTTLSLSSAPTGSLYAYSWSGPGIVAGGNTANPVVNVGGNYTVTITNTLTGCSGVTGTTNVAVPTNTTTPTLSLSATSVTTTCGNPSTTVSATSNSNPNTTYTWTAPATGTISSTSASTPTIGGTGTFTVAVTNVVNGCASSPQTVSVAADVNVPTYTLSSTSATVNCTTPAPTVTISTTPTGLSYTWSPTPNSGGNTTSPSFTAAGIYTCTVLNNSNGCSTSVPTVTVTLDQTSPTATAATSASSITCGTTSLTINSTIVPSTNVNFNWTGPNVISGSTSLSPLIGTGGSYVITMTNTVNGCTGSYTAVVPSNTVAPTMSLSANAYTTTCSAPSVIITASSDADPNTTYSWTAPGTGTISNTAISNPSIGGSGDFTVVATNTVNGCSSAIGTVSITADANIPTFTFSSGNTATITCTTPSPSISLTSTVSNVSYSWTPTPSSGGTTASPSFTATGIYTCVITNTVNNCFTNLPQVTVDADTLAPTVSIVPPSSITCASNTVDISAAANPPASTYTWSGTGISGSVNNSSITVNSAGTFSASVTNPLNGCVNNTISVTVGTDTIIPSLSVNVTSTVITCATTASTLSATSGVTWTSSTGTVTTNPYPVTAAGDYTATIVDPSNNCRHDTVITITDNIIPPDANAGAATVMPCNTSLTTLMGTSTTTTDAVSYSWTGPNVGSITSATNIAAPTVTSTGIYTLTVTNLNTGCTATSTVDVSQNSVTADFNADPMLGEIPLTVTFTNTSVGATSYSWNFGNGLSSSFTDPNTIYTNAGTYTVTLVAFSGACSDTITKTIVAEDGFTIEIPNVFTPNGDGANDAFHITITGVKSAEGFIYNRWGQLLYSWDALNTSWDGKAANGEGCPDATYYYLIKVIDNKGKEHVAPGYVLIIK